MSTRLIAMSIRPLVICNWHLGCSGMSCSGVALDKVKLELEGHVPCLLLLLSVCAACSTPLARTPGASSTTTCCSSSRAASSWQEALQPSWEAGHARGALAQRGVLYVGGGGAQGGFGGGGGGSGG